MVADCVEFRRVGLEVEGQRYLDGADLRVPTGATVVIGGLPGCGKSFVCRLILGLPGMTDHEVHLEGEVRVAGAPVPPRGSQELQALRRRIGSVMRDGGLIENMDIRSNVALPLTYHYRDVLGPALIQERCDAVLADLGVAHLGVPGIRPVTLNREERLYASLARALVCEPFLLLFDEPCAGLSPGPASRLRHFLFHYEPGFARCLPPPPGTAGAGLTRIATTADPGRYADVDARFVLLADGRLDEIGSAQQVQDSIDPRVRRLLDADASLAAVPAGVAAHV